MYKGNVWFIKSRSKRNTYNGYAILKSNEFYSHMKPMLQVMRTLGGFPFILNETGELQFKLFSAVTLYTVIIEVAMLATAARILNERMQSLFDQRPSFIEHVVDCAFIVLLLLAFVIPLVYWIELTKMLKFINSWRLFQIDFRCVTQRNLELPLRRRLLLKTCVVLPVVLIIMEANAFLVVNGLSKWWHAIPFGFCVLHSAMMIINWVEVCGAIVFIARDIIQDIGQATLMPSAIKESCFGYGADVHFFDSVATYRRVKSLKFGWSNRLEEYRKLWLKMSYLTQDLGKSAGLTFGVLNFMVFILQIIASYGLISNISRGFSSSNLAFAMSALVFSMITFYQCNAAHQTVDEVGSKFQKKLENISIQLVDRTSKSNIHYFLQTIFLNPPVISYCGFIDVNRGLLTTMFSSMITYLVVLTQFQMSSPVAGSVNQTTTETP